MSEADGVAKNTDPQLTATRNDASGSDPGATLSSSAGATLSAAERASEPKSIGPYKLIRKLGEGGMGQVWLGEQTAPIKRQVALKLIKVGTYEDSVLQRFYSERQSLAMMEHPSIAKVFDAGATPDGQPYFVMEYVPGLPVTDYCDQKRMKIRERLELFIKVCEGVQHAHQKAIMHRDLKPANILVVEVDGKPVPRIIDFGLAKAVTPPLGGETLFTQVGGCVGTPGYMSPEQADPSVVDADTRADVYSLGAVLYVLLTGFLPFETKDWRKQRFDEFLRRLLEEDPPRPSTKIGVEKESSKTTAELRRSEPKHLVSLLQGDLDWITMKALEKDRARRYGTPSELAADIERYLKHEAVLARPASTGYRLRKYVRRHRMGVAVAAGLVLLLAAFAAMQAVQLRRITRERDRANRITDFMTNMFKVSDPSEARGNSITAREILDKASNEIDRGLSNDPELQAQMMQVMGTVYVDLSLYPQAHRLLQGAVDIRSRVLGPSHPETLASVEELAWLLYEEGRNSEAEKLQRNLLDIRRRTLGPEDHQTLTSTRHLASILEHEGDYSEVEKLERETLDIERRTLGPEHPDTVAAMQSLGATLFDEHQYVEAEKLDRQALEIQRRLAGSDHPNTLALMDNLALTLDVQRQYAEAERLHREALEIKRRVLGPEHRDTARSMMDLASVLAHEGQYSEAEKLLQAERNIQRRILGSDHPETAISTYELACVAALQGRREEAVSLLREAIEHGLDFGAILDIDKDPDLNLLHGDPRFDALVAHAKEVAQSKTAVAAQKTK